MLSKRNLLVPLLGFLLAGCEPKAPQTAPPPPPTVTVVPIVKTNIVEWDEYTGRLEPVETVEIRARVNGYLAKIHFKEGSEVKKGDLLYTIDQRPYKAELDQAQAEYERSVAKSDLAKNDFERAQRLIATKAVSEEDFDSKAKAYAEAQAAVKSSAALLESARLNYDFTEIRSPIDGRISRALITEGNLVSGGVGGAGSSLLTTVVSLDPLYCYVDVDEHSVLKYIELSKEGKRESAREKNIVAEMALANETGFPHKGVIDFVDNRVDPATGTIKARGVFPNPKHEMNPGFFGRLRVPGSGEYEALMVPDRALGSDQSQKFVYVINTDKKVEYRPVTPGVLMNGLRVISGAVKAGESVITEGLVRVRPGITVDPQPPAGVAPTAKQ